MFAQDYFIGINAVNPIILFSQVDGNKKPIERSSKRVLCLLRITLLGLTQLIPNSLGFLLRIPFSINLSSYVLLKQKIG